MSDSAFYDPDNDARPQSPLLQAVRPKATPSPSPPPIVTLPATISSTQNVSPPSSRRRRKPNRRKTRPSQGDFVLIRVMDPNRPDIARLVGERALNSDSGSDAEDSDMEDRSVTAEPTPSESTQPDAPSVDLQGIAQKALDAKPPPPVFHRDSVVEPDNQPNAPTPASQVSSAGTLTNGVTTSANGLDSRTPASEPSKSEATSPNLTGERNGRLANGYPHEDSIATSPNLGELTIPQSRGSPSQKLPAFQPPHSPLRDGPGSPNLERRLPSFRHLSELAETAINEQQETVRQNSFSHRPSISSSNQSPTTVARQLSISSSRSPGTAFPPLSAASPTSTSNETTSRDLFLRSGQSHLTLFSTRRPSQASDTGPYSANTLHSASTANESYQSSDGLSPGTQPTPIEGRVHRMSIDGALNSRTLPLPNGPHVQHIPPHGSGGFKCDHPGCTAPPFQTQYLLK
jgi:hypothetical protein